MTIYELMLKVKEELESRGFTTKPFTETFLVSSAEKDGKCEWREVESCGYIDDKLFGFRIEFGFVHRNNNTKENISVDVSLYEWKRSLGYEIAKERINVRMGDKAIRNRINKIVAAFEAC